MLNTDEIGIVVLDEADQLIRSSFLADIKSILFHISPKPQVIAAIETLRERIGFELAQLMTNPISVTYKLNVPIVLDIKQFAYIIPSNDGTTDEMYAKFNAIQHIFSVVQFKHCIIFSHEQSHADSCCKYLSENGWSAASIITAHQYENVHLKQFQSFDCRILVSTDVMVRRVHSENVNFVINLDMPADISTYLHRIGHCCRGQGMAVTLSVGDLERSQFQLLLGTLGGVTMIAEKFPHGQEIGDIWKYRSHDVRDKIVGTESVFEMKKPVINFVTQNPGVSTAVTVPDSLSDDEEWCVTAATNPIQTENADSDKKLKANSEQNVSFIKAASLLIDLKGERQPIDEIEDSIALIDIEDKPTKNTEEDLPELELGNPFNEYNTLRNGKEARPKTEDTVTVPENSLSLFSINNILDTSVSCGSNYIDRDITSKETSPIHAQCPVNDQFENLQLSNVPVEELNCQVNEITKNPSIDEQPTNSSVTEFDSINGTDPFESIFQSEIAQKLPSPLIAVTKVEVLTTFHMNIEEPTSEFDVSLKNLLQNTLKLVFLQDEVSESSQLKEDIVDECIRLHDKTEPPQCVKPHDIDSTIVDLVAKDNPDYQSDVIQAKVCDLKCSSSMISTDDLINLHESMESPTEMSDIEFLNEDPFEYLSKSILIAVQAEPTEAIIPSESNDVLLDAIPRIEFYLNTKNKEVQSPTELDVLAFDGQEAKLNKIDSDDRSNTNTELNSNTSALNAASNTEPKWIEFCIQADKEIDSSLSLCDVDDGAPSCDTAVEKTDDIATF